MIVLIGLTVEADIALTIIREIVDEFGLKLWGTNPICIFKSDDRAFFYAEVEHQEQLDMLDIDECIDVVWYDPVFYQNLDDAPISGLPTEVQKLERLFKEPNFPQESS